MCSFQKQVFYDVCVNVGHVMLKPGFSVDAKKDFHEHPGQISIVNVLQAKPINWNTNYIENTSRELLVICSLISPISNSFV